MTAANYIDPLAALLDQLADAPACRLCGGYGGAHYGWCRQLVPASAWQAFPARWITGAQWQAPANLDEHLAAVDQTVRQLAEAAGVPAEVRPLTDDERQLLDAAIDRHPAGRRRRTRQRLQLVTPALTEAQASVALDGDTHVVGEPAPATRRRRPDSRQRAAHRQRQVEADAVAAWLIERVDLDAAGQRLGQHAALDAYHRWIDADAPRLTVQRFARAMTAAGYRPGAAWINGRTQRAYAGLALLPEVDEHLADEHRPPAGEQQPVPAPAPTPAPPVVDEAPLNLGPRRAPAMPVDQHRGERPGRELRPDMRDLVRQLVDECGWRYQRGHGRTGKPRLYPPGGARFVSLPLTPSDRRSLANLRGDLRRALRDCGREVPAWL